MPEEPQTEVALVQGVRKSGKQWKAPKAPNKNPLVRTTFARRITKAKQIEATKALERQLIEERKQTETERKEASKARKAAKEEKERYELMKAKMHAKLVERRKKREKKNRPK